jgi:hypothetical protein
MEKVRIRDKHPVSATLVIVEGIFKANVDLLKWIAEKVKQLKITLSCSMRIQESKIIADLC